MQQESNQISRDWTILHNGRRFYVNYTESDGQTLALMNRDKWEVLEETDDGPEQLTIYIFRGDTPKQRKAANENALLKEKLIKFCIENWDSKFMQEIRKEIAEQAKLLDAL